MSRSGRAGQQCADPARREPARIPNGPPPPHTHTHTYTQAGLPSPLVDLRACLATRGAGTDSDVHVALHGDLGDTPAMVLPSRPEHFERGQSDSFRWGGPSACTTYGSRPLSCLASHILGTQKHAHAGQPTLRHAPLRSRPTG
jgi:hypothetical protein